MKKLLYTEDYVDWIGLPKGTLLIETYLSDEMPEIQLCASAYGIVFKDGALLQTDLREGERPTRRLDIPGGHIDPGEVPEESVVREVFEETGVHVKVNKLIAYKKVIHNSPKPENWRYSYPVGYMLFFLCTVLEETEFEGNEETHGRVWIEKNDLRQSYWYTMNKKMLNEIANLYETKN